MLARDEAIQEAQEMADRDRHTYYVWLPRGSISDWIITEEIPKSLVGHPKLYVTVTPSQKAHSKGWGCDHYYAKVREKQRCSCGRLSKYGPVCDLHNTFPTQKIANFPPTPKCPGPHS